MKMLHFVNPCGNIITASNLLSPELVDAICYRIGRVPVYLPKYCTLAI